MQLTGAVEAFLLEKEREGRADFPDIQAGIRAFSDYLTDWTPVPVGRVNKISMVHFQEFFSWWYIRKCRPNPTAARHLLYVMEEFCRFIFKRFEVNLLPIYRPVLAELKEALPRVITLQIAISPVKSQEYLRYMIAAYGEERAKEMGFLGEYEDVVHSDMEVVCLGEGTEVYFRNLHEDYEIGPVKVSLEAAKLVREGDIISLELGEKDGTWEIIDSGFAYPSLAKRCQAVPKIDKNFKGGI